MSSVRTCVTALVLAAIALAALGVWADPCSSHSARRGVYYREALEAQAKARAAARAEARREAAREREARERKALIRTYTAKYGSQVGRWAPLVRRSFGRGPLPFAMFIVYRESRGIRCARNPYSDCRGLFQLHPCHWRGRFDPYNAERNVKYAAKLWRGAGWRPWGY